MNEIIQEITRQKIKKSLPKNQDIPSKEWKILPYGRRTFS
jgi:hypothetical protein